MANSENKTKPTKTSVKKFLNSIEDKTKRADSFKILEMMKSITKEEPVMWGPSIVGFGKYHYKYASGREGDMPLAGFSPRKQNLTLYIMSGSKENKDLLKKLGKHKTGASCLYIKKLENVDTKVLKEMIKRSYSYMKKKKWD